MILDVPVVLQTGDEDCGKAAAKAVFRYHGRRMPDPSPLGIPCPIDGTPPGVLEPLFRSAGFHVEAGNSRLATLKHHADGGRPAVVLVEMYGDSHWVVFRGKRQRRVYLMDPTAGPTDMTAAKFESIWRGTSRHGDLYDQWAIVVTPK